MRGGLIVFLSVDAGAIDFVKERLIVSPAQCGIVRLRIAQCLNGGYGWPEVECHRCKTRASLPLDAIRWPRGRANLEARDAGGPAPARRKHVAVT